MFKLFTYFFFICITFQKTREEKQFENYLRSAIKTYIVESKPIVDNSLFSFAEKTRTKLKELENLNLSKKQKHQKSKKIIDNQFKKLLFHVKESAKLYFDENEKNLKEDIEKLHPKESSDNWDTMKKDYEKIIHDYYSNLIKRTRIKFDIRTKFLAVLKENVNTSCDELNTNYHEECVSQILNYLRALSPMIFTSYKPDGLVIENETKKEMLLKRESAKEEVNGLQKSIIITKKLYKDLEIIKNLSYDKNVKDLLQNGLDIFDGDIKRYESVIKSDNERINDIDDDLKENNKTGEEGKENFIALLARSKTTIDN